MSPPDHDWIHLPGATFRMGVAAGPSSDPAAFAREGPMHDVTLAAFAIGRHPVTVAAYGTFVDEGGYADADWWAAGGFGATPTPAAWAEQRDQPHHPVVGVSWFEAMAFAAWSAATLPTEAQWEYAARGVEGRRFPWGDEAPAAGRLNSIEAGRGGPTPVGRFPAGATPTGVHDLAGNVWEWCRDRYGGYTLPVQEGDGERVADGRARVFRGGCFAAKAEYCRGAMRGYGEPEQRFARRGFRLGRDG